jgi:hypothetical protein
LHILLAKISILSAQNGRYQATVTTNNVPQSAASSGSTLVMLAAQLYLDEGKSNHNKLCCTHAVWQVTRVAILSIALDTY